MTKDSEKQLKVEKGKEPLRVVKNTNNTMVRSLIEVGLIAIVSIDEVNPYDESHFPFGDERWKDIDELAKEHNDPAWTEKYHRDGVDVLKKELEKGYMIRPILVCNALRRQDLKSAEGIVDMTKLNYQRLDGFKRYMAMKELGYDWIVVQIISSHIGNGQGGQPWVL